MFKVFTLRTFSTVIGVSYQLIELPNENSFEILLHSSSIVIVTVIVLPLVIGSNVFYCYEASQL